MLEAADEDERMGRRRRQAEAENKIQQGFGLLAVSGKNAVSHSTFNIVLPIKRPDEMAEAYFSIEHRNRIGLTHARHQPRRCRTGDRRHRDGSGWIV